MRMQLRASLVQPIGNHMPGQIRPDKALRKVAYKILKTPKDLQQKDDRRPAAERVEAWKINSSLSPRYN